MIQEVPGIRSPIKSAVYSFIFDFCILHNICQAVLEPTISDSGAFLGCGRHSGCAVDPLFNSADRLLDMLRVYVDLIALPIPFHIEQNTGGEVLNDDFQGFLLEDPKGTAKVVPLNLQLASGCDRASKCFPPVTWYPATASIGNLS